MSIKLDCKYYHVSHYAVLPTQSNVYGITELSSSGNKSRMLVTSRLGKVFSLEFSKNKLSTNPISKEVKFTLPSGNFN